MEPSLYVPLGRVVKTHGLKGEVAVAPAGDLPFVFAADTQVWLVPPVAGVSDVYIESVSGREQLPFVKLRNVDDIGVAKSLVGREILARADDLPAAWLEEPDDSDIAGFSVFDEEHGLLGEVVEVIITGANDVWVVEGPLGEVLLPVIDDVVLSVDDDERRIDVRLLPGLLDEAKQ
jgi:16S rRNA processing protein RimM